MTIIEMQEILLSLQYKDWEFHLIEENNTAFLQLRFKDMCACRDSAPLMEHRCRKWRLSLRATRSEIVQTAFAAVLLAEEHEIRERFRYRGRAVYGPHFNVDDLVNLCDTHRTDMRVNSYPVDGTAD